MEISLQLPLKGKTSPLWAEHIVANFDAFLQDHASCERKAAALAMSFVAKYAERTRLIEPLVALAREELEHFQQVYRLMRSRGVPLQPGDEKDPYINALLAAMRHGHDERFLDRLIMSGLVEARGFERFNLLADHLPEGNLRQFYRELARKEAGHYKIFYVIARDYFPEEAVLEAIERISEIESVIMREAPLRAALH